MDIFVNLSKQFICSIKVGCSNFRNFKIQTGVISFERTSIVLLASLVFTAALTCGVEVCSRLCSVFSGGAAADDNELAELQHEYEILNCSTVFLISVQSKLYKIV